MLSFSQFSHASNNFPVILSLLASSNVKPSYGAFSGSLHLLTLAAYWNMTQDQPERLPDDTHTGVNE